MDTKSENIKPKNNEVSAADNNEAAATEKKVPRPSVTKSKAKPSESDNGRHESNKKNGALTKGNKTADGNPPPALTEDNKEEDDIVSSGGLLVKTPKGMRDTMPAEMIVRNKAFATITQIYERHGGKQIDTPVLERYDTLMGKYGEESKKLIYELDDQGGERLVLRYDLTVPFARHVAQNSIKKMKRYHLGRVYRRDNPVMSRGRFREFFQCDFDIAGADQLPMAADAECVAILCEVLYKLEIGQFQVKVNHRKLLDAVMEMSGVPSDRFRSICSSIDKLDKEPWEAVQAEMIGKGISEESANKIGTFVNLRGAPQELLRVLLEREELKNHPTSFKALQDMQDVFKYIEAFGYLDRVLFDMSLARGLDYYSGIILEAVLLDSDKLGSIAGGGRYDGLVGMFSGTPIPAVGFSIGLERLLSILLEVERKKVGQLREKTTQVLVCSIGKNTELARMSICSQLWRAGIAAEFFYHPNPKPGKQVEEALRDGVPVVVFVGENEIAKKEVSVKYLPTGVQTSMNQDQMVPFVLKLLNM